MNDDTTQSGTGVSLKFVEGSASKFKVTTDEPTKGAGIYVTGGSDAVANYAKSFKGKFELKLKYKANVKVTVAGNGSNDGRWLVVANSSGTKLHEKTFASEASTLADAEEIDLGEVPGGIYTVYALGCRIFKVSAKNNVSTVVPVPITGVTATAAAASINVGGTTKLTATVTPSTTTENKTVTWEVKEGSANIELSATTGEEITVTGKAAGTAKIVAKAGTFTSSEVTVTVTAADLTKQSGTFEIDLSNATKESILTSAEIASITADQTKVSIADGRILDGKNYFKIVGGNSSWMLNSAQTKVTEVELKQSGGKGVVANMTQYITFTVTGSAVLSITGRNSSSTKGSDIFVYNADNTAVDPNETTFTGTSTKNYVYGNTQQTYTYNLSAGVYKIATCMVGTTPEGGEWTATSNSPLRIQKLSAVQTVQ